eukprot:m.155297 g.155297  ORF g.155297 m.155297 type:complete len:483 (+) comp38666_c0_seq1:42-1490(+)
MCMLAVLLLGFCSASSLLATPLDDYVQKPDPHYEYEEIWQPYLFDKIDIHYLNMTSQKWLQEDDTSQPIWWHIMNVIIPHDVKYPDHALLFITGGNNGNSKPGLTDEELSLMTQVTLKTGMVGAILYQIPNQPILFRDDPFQKHRIEDAVIAYTWYRFLQNTSRSDLLLRLPMTKAAVRALDTVTDFVSKKKSLSISKFMVAGASKRGWTTWTTAAVDKRVVAIAPIVLDVINVQANFHHIWHSYGNWSFAMKDYYDLNVTMHVFDPNFAALTAVVDPIAYADRLTMPKYIISTTGDEFQMPDDTLFYGRELPGETYYRMIPNAEHSCAGHAISLMLGMTAFFLSVVENYPRPEMWWNMTRTAEGGAITLHSPTKPLSIQMWHATTIDENRRRDFRLLFDPSHAEPIIHPVIWFEASVTQTTEGTYYAERSNPKLGWTAFFIQVTYEAPLESDMMFTTQVNIIPDTFPYPDCHGEGCRGSLI